MSETIRSLFSPSRPIDRQIEKVIDYYAQDEERLAKEISEYEITENIESCFRKFLEAYEEGVTGGYVPEVGIWVSGFYGSGKSSFTKYLGTALNPERRVGNTPFLELLCERFTHNEVPALLRSVSKKHPAAVVMLDLGAEQLIESTAAPVTEVLYWKVLQWVGFSKEKKTAQLEFTLERKGLLDKFKEKYRERYGADWFHIHNDPLIGVNRAAEIVPDVLPDEFPTPDSFRSLKFSEARDVRDLTAEIIELVRKKTGMENIIFFIDEAGQYVAPRGELILNLDGMSRNFRELGQGKVWVVATGQQTLSEIVEKALHNSAELNKLKDRFPISITLEASDIREITHRRLLEKSEEGRKKLEAMYDNYGQSLITYTRLENTVLYRSDPDHESFTRFYPFLQQHFELLLELIRNLARSTGGIGLRSAIRVIQDALVDKSKVLPPNVTRLADRGISELATADQFYDILRTDISRDLPHVVKNVAKTEQIFGSSSWETKVAKVVAVLQVLDNFPRNYENIAALLFNKLGSAPCQGEVQKALNSLVSKQECGLIDDPQAGGYIFLSDAVKPIRDKRNSYVPTGNELTREEVGILKDGTSDYPLFRSQPSTRIEQVKEVKATVKYGRTIIKGGKEDVEIRLEYATPESFSRKREEFLVSTNAQAELKNTLILLVERRGQIDDLLVEIVKSEKTTEEVDESTADRDVTQYVRSERRLAENYRSRAAKEIESAIMEGLFIFKGSPTPVREHGETLDSAIGKTLQKTAKSVFSKYHLAPIRPATDVASKFISVERLDRMTSEKDPLHLVITSGSPRVNIDHQALAEVQSVIKKKVLEIGSGRLQGSVIQDLFSSPPYGWTRDTVRYLIAALLRAGEIELHKPGADAVIKTAGKQAEEAFKSTVEFNRVGVSIRDTRPETEALERAAKSLEELFGDQVLPLEDLISQNVRKNMPGLFDKINSLPYRLRLLELPGEERAQQLLTDISDLRKGDASDAAAHLGGLDSKLPQEIKWGKSVIEALDSGAENEIRKAKDLMKVLNELETMFPGTLHDFLNEEDMESLNEVLQSESFYKKLPDMRAIIRKTEERICNHYRHEKQRYEEEIKKFKTSLERMQGWANLTEDERADVLSQLEPNLPPEANNTNPAQSLKLGITRRQTLPTLFESLKKIVQEAEKPIHVTGEGDDPDADDERVVLAGELVEPWIIENEDDINNWVETLKIKITDLLKHEKRVRIEK